MSNLATTGYDTFESDWDAPSGRHALSEDAVLTPIFHALTRGGLRAGSRPARLRPPADPPDPVENFRRDPLTAPIPAARPWWRCRASRGEARSPSRSPAGSAAGGRARGRHHRRLRTVAYDAPRSSVGRHPP